MKSKKILIIIPIILIILLVAVAGVGATLYFTTDLFKSPKQLFFKYLGNSITSDDFDYDKSLAELKKQYELTSKSEGKIKIDLDSDELVKTLSKNKNTKDYADIVKNIGKAEIKYTAESVPTQSKSRFSLTPAYDNKDITNIQLVENGNNYGLKCDDLYNKYVYVENNELNKLLKRFGVENSALPDKIEKVNYYELLNIPEKSRKEIKDKYSKFFDEKLTKDMFSVNKKVSTSVNDSQVEATAYNFTINEVQAYDIMTSFLETLKNDETTLNLVVERFHAAGITSTKVIDNSSSDDDEFSSIISKTNYKTVDVNKDFIIESINDCLDELNDEKSSADSSKTMTFTMYIQDKKLVKFEAKDSDNESASIQITTNGDERTISIFNDNEKVLKAVFTLTTNNNSTNLNGNAEIYDDNELTSKVEYTISISDNYSKTYFKVIPDVESDDETVEINVESKGRIGEENVQTSGYLKFDIEGAKATINFEQTTEYPNEINIDELNSDNGICLNSASNTEIKTAFSAITKKFSSILPEKAKIFGIDIKANNNKNNNSNVINEKELTNYTEYSDASGVKFKYPSSWKSNNSTTTPGFMNSSNGTNVNLTSENVGNYDLEKYVEISTTNLKKVYAEKINGDINKTAVKLNNRDCYILDYKISQSNITANIKQVVFIDGGKAYVLTTTMRDSEASTDTEIINNIICTLKK